MGNRFGDSLQRHPLIVAQASQQRMPERTKKHHPQREEQHQRRLPVRKAVVSG
jgi:hypothetical protein